MKSLWRLVLYGITIALLSFPACAREPSVGNARPNGISARLQQASVPTGERIEVRLTNGTTLKGVLRDYSHERMVVNINASRPKDALPLGETTIDYTSISKFKLRTGARNRGASVFGGIVGFFVGCLPGMAISLNNYGSKTSETVGPVVMLAGGVTGAWLGSKLGARKMITVEVTP